jgi:hypothetical protein
VYEFGHLFHGTLNIDPISTRKYTTKSYKKGQLMNFSKCGEVKVAPWEIQSLVSQSPT